MKYKGEFIMATKSIKVTGPQINATKEIDFSDYKRNKRCNSISNVFTFEKVYALSSHVDEAGEKEEGRIQKIINSTEKMIAAEKIASVVANLKTEKYLELFNTWAKTNEKEVLVSLTSAQCSDCIKINCKDENLVIGFSFDSSNFRNFYYGLTWKDGKERDINYIEKHYPKQKDWGQAAWWPYWKYFSKEYLHPGDNLDFLFDDKKKLYKAMDDALEEMDELLSVISDKCVNA
jgi:hypothetical protein